MSVELDFWAKSLNEAVDERRVRHDKVLKSDYKKKPRHHDHFSIFEHD